MASTFNLTRNAVAVNLISGTDAGWRATRWRPQVAAVTGNRMPPLVTETVNFMVDEATHDQLATTFQAMDNYRWLAREYIHDRTQEHPVWLHAKMNNETGERRALVYDVGLQWQVDQVDENGMWVCEGDAQARASITRGAFWEDTTANGKSSAVNLSILAGTWDYSGVDVVGDAPARIAALDLRHQNATHYCQYWIGFRGANKHGTLANFVPIWELESGTVGTDTALHADATASPGGGGNTCLQCTFATATWASRATIYLSDVTVNYSDNLGRYVCLLRAKVDAGTTAEVRLSQGYHTTPVLDGVVGPTVEITSTAWAIYDLGIVTIPLRDMHVFPLATWAATYERYYKLILQARRTGGAGNLEMDCLVMIPYDELFFYVNRPETYSANNRMIFGQSPEGLWSVYGYLNATPSYWTEIGEISAYGLGVPVGDGRAYLVLADANDANTFTDLYKAELDLYPRWYNLRGAE